DVADGSSTNGVRTVILSSRITTALTTTDSITINFPSAVAKAAAAYKVAGLVTSGTILDKTHTGTGSGDSPDSGLTATTSQNDESLIGATGVENKNASLTAGSGYTTMTCA